MHTSRDTLRRLGVKCSSSSVLPQETKRGERVVTGGKVGVKNILCHTEVVSEPSHLPLWVVINEECLVDPVQLLLLLWGLESLDHMTRSY